MLNRLNARTAGAIRDSNRGGAEAQSSVTPETSLVLRSTGRLQLLSTEPRR